MKEFFKMFFASLFGVFAASFLILLIGLFFVIGIAAIDTNVVSINKKTVLEVDISGVIYDRYQDSPLDALTSSYSEEKKTSLIDLLNAIDRAKDHPLIAGIYLKANPMLAGYATATELRDKLAEFKKGGKFVYAYADVYSQKSYYVASVADTIALNPIGMVELSGMNSSKMYYKGVLEKLGVEMQVFKVGTFKSAVEPFIRSNRSSEDRSQTDSYLRSIWSTIGTSIAQSRKISLRQLDEWINQGIVFGESKELVEKNIVDVCTYESDVAFYAENKMDRISTRKFLASTSDLTASSDKIALVFAEGEIDGSSSEGIVSPKLIKELKAIREDDRVKAVVFRVNSPGGSGFGSEQIWNELSKIKKTKPVIISMGDYAASGGYYISCMADAIVAQPTTLTGSIGVFGLFPDFQKMFGKIGLAHDVVKTHVLADFGDVSRPMNELEKRLMQKNVNTFYDLFLTRCSDGRELEKKSVDSIAQGRVWSGQQAMDLKLVDQMGGLSKALEIAAKKAKLSKYEVVEYPVKKEWFVRLMNDLNAQMKAGFTSFFTSEEKKLIKELRKINSRDRVRAEMEVVPVLD